MRKITCLAAFSRWPTTCSLCALPGLPRLLLIAAPWRVWKERIMNGASPCGALLEHIQQEHHHLNTDLIAIRHELERLSSDAQGPLPPETIKRLKDLRTELEGHFHHEECGGCLEEAASRVPSVSHQVRQIEAEHRELLSAIDRLNTAAASPSGSRASVAREFADFAARLHAHEVAETRLIEYALGGEAADYDIEGNE
jgi:hypothetical protein